MTAAFGHEIEAKLARVPAKLGSHIGAETVELICALTDELTGDVNRLLSGMIFSVCRTIPGGGRAPQRPKMG